MTTDNSKGGTSRTSFVDGSFDKVLSKFRYDSKDYFKYKELSDELHNKIIVFDPFLTPYYNFDDDDPNFDLFKNLYIDNDEFTEVDNADSIIRTAFDRSRDNAISTYHKSVNNYSKLSDNDKYIMSGNWFNGTSGITVFFNRFVDSRDGYFVFEIYQKDTNTTTLFRVYDSTEVYFKTTSKDNLKSYRTLDEKVLAVCSEISVNSKIQFGILKSNSLKEYKDVEFIVIGE